MVIIVLDDYSILSFINGKYENKAFVDMNPPHMLKWSSQAFVAVRLNNDFFNLAVDDFQLFRPFLGKLEKNRLDGFPQQIIVHFSSARNVF